MARKPSAEQIAFAKAIVLKGLNHSEAFREAFPEKVKTMTAAQIARAANKKYESVGVSEAIKALRDTGKKLFENEISRESLLSDVAQLISVSKENAYVKAEDEYGQPITVLNDKAATILLKAMERAARMIGADEPEQVHNNIVVTFEGDFDKYGE